jgi:exodeoxyribonuclease VIII
MTSNGVVVDLKTTTDASPKGFAKAVWKFRYHVQDAFYTDGIEASTGCRPTDFVFIAVEKTAPFGVGVYRLSEGLREEGRELYLDDVKTWQECMSRNEWPAYSDEIIEII